MLMIGRENIERWGVQSFVSELPALDITIYLYTLRYTAHTGTEMPGLLPGSDNFVTTLLTLPPILILS